MKKEQRPQVIAYFRNGGFAQYTFAVLPLLMSDKNVVAINVYEWDYNTHKETIYKWECSEVKVCE